jgi:tetratricopeptide (TPR) repeat protein
MGKHGERSADSDLGNEMDDSRHHGWRVSKEGWICGIVALALVISSAGLLLWRMNANPKANQERAVVPEGPEQLNEAAWRVVRDRRASPDQYARALEQAEDAVRGSPGNGYILNTLGVAHYRTGRYADALATLTKSEKMNATKEGSHPADLAFLAMAQHQLGQKAEAQGTLERLHEVMKNLRWFKDAEARGFLGEAEETLKTTKNTKNTKKED